MKHVLLALAVLTAVIGCKGQSSTSAAETPQQKSKQFKMVSIPQIYTEPEDRAKYLVAHYWDNFDFSDTTSANLSETAETAFVDYLSVLPYVSADVSASSIKDMLTKAQVADSVYFFFTDMYEKYLYDARSPMHNEEYYIPVLEQELLSPNVKEKTRVTALLNLVNRNRVGQPAINFDYTTASGKSGNLYSLKTPYTILFFFDPDCQECKKNSESIKNSEPVNNLLSKGQITMLAIYADADVAAWKTYATAAPATWTVGHDGKQSINNGELYDLKAMPTIYLLDKDKKVLLKDVSFEQLQEYCRNILQSSR
jgi:peroxiredoxin